MPTPEQLAVCIASLKNAVKLRLWSSPIWVQELLTAYENVKNEADAWRRTYNQVSDAYRDLLASKPEVYLVDGHDAAYWRRWYRRVMDIVIERDNKYAALHTRHEALSTEYLALRTRYERLRQVASYCESELTEVRQMDS